MGNKLYVGGLPYSLTEARLQEIFAAHGTVESAKVIKDKFTGQSRGFGFVEMGSGGEAQRAIQALNGTAPSSAVHHTSLHLLTLDNVNDPAMQKLYNPPQAD